MSCNCFSNPCNQVAKTESVASWLDNLALSLFGEITKTVTNGRAVWQTPCSTSEIFAAYPRENNEGLICYLLRIMRIVGWNFTGVYSGAASYKIGDIVTLNNTTLYRCIKPVSGVAPPNATYWQFVLDVSSPAVGANAIVANPTALSTNPIGVALAANQFLARSSTGNIEAKPITDFGLSLMNAANDAAARITLGVPAIAHTHPWSDITGVSSLPPRERLTADRTYYVSPSGSDSNDGLFSSTPFLTIQKAIDVVLDLDFNKYTVSIQLADGTYTAGANLTRPVLGGTLIIRGNSVAPSHVIISTTGDDAIKVSNNAVVTVIDMRVQTTTSGSCIFADSGGTVYFGNIDFHGCASAHIYATNQAFVGTVGNYSITGGVPYHILAENSATVVVLGRTITLTGTPNFSAYFVIVQSLGLARLPSNTFSGSATGARYRADLNAVISVSGASTTYLPGDSAGVTNFGGQYV